MRHLEDIPKLENVPVLVRGALNVPTSGGAVVNAYRIRRALPTLTYLQARHARTILISHLGEQGTETLEPVARTLATLLPNVTFFPETTGPRVRNAVRDLRPGHILVLENLRRNRGEVGNDLSFATELAGLADVFVQDSFDTCHRSHASMVRVPTLLPSYAGVLLAEEVAALSQALHPEPVSLAVIGGAKFSTKEPVLTALFGAYSHVFVGGALANDFLHARGHQVGKSLVSIDDVSHIDALSTHAKLLLPLDVYVVPSADLDTPYVRERARLTTVDDVGRDEVILDHGPQTGALITTHARAAKSILWNGPVGNYERGFSEGTDAVARAIAASGAHSVVGGGDTIAAIEKLGLFSKYSFVSTGGGAMLDFLAHGTLPGIAALG